MVPVRSGNCWLPPSNRDHKFTNGWLNAFIKCSAFFLGSPSFSCSQELLEVSFFENNCNAKPLHWTPESLSFFLVRILFLSFSCPSLPCSSFFSHELFAFFWYSYLTALLQTFLFSKLHFQLFFFLFKDSWKEKFLLVSFEKLTKQYFDTQIKVRDWWL